MKFKIRRLPIIKDDACYGSPDGIYIDPFKVWPPKHKMCIVYGRVWYDIALIPCKLTSSSHKMALADPNHVEYYAFYRE